MMASGSFRNCASVMSPKKTGSTGIIGVFFGSSATEVENPAITVIATASRNIFIFRMISTRISTLTILYTPCVVKSQIKNIYVLIINSKEGATHVARSPLFRVEIHETTCTYPPREYNQSSKSLDRTCS